MTTLVQTRLSAAEFDVFAALPENTDRLLELLDEEIIEKIPAGRKSSRTSSTIVAYVTLHVNQNHLGEVTDAQGGYWIGQNRFIPDGAFVRRDRLPIVEVDGYATVAPDLAINVISPTDRASTIARKVAAYMRYGTILWLVDPVEQTLTVYRPTFDTITYTRADTLTDETLLPGFSLNLRLVFVE